MEKPLSVSDVSTGRLGEEMCKLKIVDEEVKGRLRIGDILCSAEKQRYLSRKETDPALVEERRQELARVGSEVREGISKKKVCVNVSH